MKKITSLALVMILVLTTLAVGTLFASATQANYVISGETLTFSDGTDAKKPALTADEISNIKKVRFDDGVKTITGATLAGLNKLSTVSIGKDVESIAADAFRNSSSVTQVDNFEVDSENKYFTVISGGKYLVRKNETEIIRAAAGYSIPSADVSSKITKIGSYAFESNNLSGTITIPDNVRVIGAYAFSKNNISSIEKLGNQLNTIEEYAFADCSNLTSIGSIENPVLYVASYAFRNAALTITNFNGTDSEWNSVAANDSALKNATVMAKNNTSEWVVYDSISKDGTLDTNPLNEEYTSGIKVTASTPVSVNAKTFLGWSTSSTGSSVAYKAGDALNLDGTKSIRLYAVFGNSAAEYWKITFDANGGKLDTALENGVSVEKGRSYTFPATGAENELYDLLGWAAKADATKADYKPGSTFTPSSDTTLYAIWNKEGPFTVKFDGNVKDNDPDPVSKVPETNSDV
ncbi:MAG: leucine-rich repeat protein, partial [Clostridia bacterium]|nr:leucine-rich repeat protein [Clostridia bacterium]MBR4242110.1 leucine-rich repeat protein [Eubacterium sp.]